LPQGLDLGVRAAETPMVALSNDPPTPGDDAADHRIRLDAPQPAGG
jgi:hypothetical protein